MLAKTYRLFGTKTAVRTPTDLEPLVGIFSDVKQVDVLRSDALLSRIIKLD